MYRTPPNRKRNTQSNLPRRRKQKICTVHHRTEKGIRKAIYPERNQVLPQRTAERIRAHGEYRQAQFLFHLRQSEKGRNGSTARRTAQTGGKKKAERQTVTQCRERARAFAPFLFSWQSMEKIYYLTYVVGERGVGKTTLLAHFATEYMIPPRAISDLLLCKQEIARLRAGGWDNLSLAPHVQHLVYVVDDTFIARGLGYMPRVSMELQFEKIGLYV